MSKMYAIGGMIGVGKSTLLTELKKSKALEKEQYVFLEEFREDDKFFELLLKSFYEGINGAEFPLQTYFIGKHQKHQKMNDENNLIMDRFIIEHWLFAQHNLKNSAELKSYDVLFWEYVRSMKKPDVYFILEGKYNYILENIKKRGRAVELENFDKNSKYFRKLNETYVKKLIALCTLLDIPYLKIDMEKHKNNMDTLTKNIEKIIIGNYGMKNLDKTENKL